VHVADLDARGAEAAAAEIGGWAHVGDLTDPAVIDALPDELDVLVNNAEFQPEQFARIQALMVTAPFLLIRRSLPAMYARGWGRIVNVSSVHGLRASAYKSAYVSAKHGLEGFTKVVAIEGAAHGVTANCVSPGYVRTPLVEGQIEAQAATHGIPAAEVVEKIMLARSAI